MALLIRSGRTCGSPGCAGHVGPMLAPPKVPNLWIRLDERGRWAASEEPPLWPQESAAPFGYRCFECGRTSRLVLARAQPLRLRNAF